MIVDVNVDVDVDYDMCNIYCMRSSLKSGRCVALSRLDSKNVS